MVTTIGPWKRPAGTQASGETNMEIVVSRSTLRTGTPRLRPPGRPEAGDYLRLPQNAACRFPAQCSSEVNSQYSALPKCPVRE
jgi:hypothetical protein